MIDFTAEAKRLVREKMRNIRAGYDVTAIREKSDRVVAQLSLLAPFAGAKAVCCYLALPHEVQTAAILEICWNAGRRVCVPFFDAAQDAYALAWLDRDEPLRPGPVGILQPIEPRPAPAGDVDFIVVPGVAFDRRGHRLGHGGGHYDRLLAQGRAFKAGVAFETQLIDPVPVGPADVSMDVVVTERCIYPSAAQAPGDVTKQ